MKLTSLISLTGLTLTLPLSAATIVDFDFSGVSGTVTQDAAAFELTATDTIDAKLKIKKGLNFQSPSTLISVAVGGQATNDLNINSWGGSASATIGDAVSGNRYISFTVQVVSGFELNLNGASVNFTACRNGGGAPEKFGVLAKKGRGTFEVTDQIGVILTPFGAPGSGSTGAENAQIFSFTFSGAEWDNVTESVEIRLYGWGGTGNMHIQDASITNASVVAAPGARTSVLISFGGLSVGLRSLK